MIWIPGVQPIHNRFADAFNIAHTVSTNEICLFIFKLLLWVGQCFFSTPYELTILAVQITWWNGFLLR
jgi:hypothetical protein